MSGHDKTLVVEFSFAALGGFSASLQEAIKTYMPQIQSQMATRFTGIKLGVIGSTGDIMKVGISYQGAIRTRSAKPISSFSAVSLGERLGERLVHGEAPPLD